MAKRILQAVCIILLGATLVWAVGSWAPHNYRYIPQLTTQGTTDYAQIVISENLTDTTLFNHETSINTITSSTEGSLAIRSVGEKWVGQTGPTATSYDTLAHAVTTIGATQMTLVVPPGTHAGGGLTIPDTLRLRVLPGALITCTSASPITFSGTDPEAGPYKIFNWTGSGSVVGLKGPTLPEWLGADIDNSVFDSAPAINEAGLATLGGDLVYRSGTYWVGQKVYAYASMKGSPNNTIIKAQPGFSGTMMVDFYTGNPTVPGKSDIYGIIFDANNVSGLNIFTTSLDNGRGNATHIFSSIEFKNVVGAYAIYCHNTGGFSPALSGFTAGSKFTRIKFNNCEGQIYSGANSDDVLWDNVRFDCNSGNFTLTPIRVSGINNTFHGCFLAMEQANFYPIGAAAIKAPIYVQSQTFKADGMFIESYGSIVSDFTHIFHMGTVGDTQYALWNIVTNLNNAGAGSLVGLVHARIGDTGRNFPVLDLKNIRDEYDKTAAVSWKVVDLWVVATVTTQYLTLNIGGLDYYDLADLVSWNAGGVSQTLPSVYIFGMHKSVGYAHGFTDTLGISVPATVQLSNWPFYKYSVQNVVGASPQTANYQLPSQGIWRVTTVAYVGSVYHVATRVDYVNWYNNTNTILLTTEEVGDSFTTANPPNIASLALGNPSTSGVVTATVAWNVVTNYICTFHFKAELIHNYGSNLN